MDPTAINKFRTNGQIPYKQSWSNRRTQKTSPDPKHSIEEHANTINHRISIKCRATSNGVHQLSRGSYRSSADEIKTHKYSDASCTRKLWNSELNISTLSLDDRPIDTIESNGRSARNSNVNTSLDHNDNCGQLRASVSDAIEISNSNVELTLSDHKVTEQITIPHRKRSGTWP